MAALIFRKKHFLYSVCVAGVLIAAYSVHISSVGDKDGQGYFDGPKMGGAPTSRFVLPVSIIMQASSGSSLKPLSTGNTSLTIPSNARCESDLTLCNKILFTSAFSDTDKRKYQSLIIKQIKNIDAILTTATTIEDTIYSITLDGGQGSRRGRAGKSTISINLGNINSDEEFLEILTHELGHVIDLGIIQGSARTRQGAFYNIDHTYFPIDDASLSFYSISRLTNETRRSDATALGFVGGYAMSDPFEDFAESFNMYLNHHHVFALLSANNPLLKKKYTFIEKLFSKKYLQADVATATRMKNDPEERAWDTTKGY